MIHTLKYTEIVKIFKAFGYPLHMKGDYNLNLFGIRNQDMKAGTFNDIFYGLYPINQGVVIKSFQCTTDPGTYWLEHPMRRAGCAVLKSNEHYKGLWEIAKFKDQYDAYCQKKPCKVHRDNDKNTIINVVPGEYTEGIYAICMHKTVAFESNTKSSAGCQVIPMKYGYKPLLNMGYDQIKFLGINSFSYSLFESKDIIQILGVG